MQAIPLHLILSLSIRCTESVLLRSLGPSLGMNAVIICRCWVEWHDNNAADHHYHSAGNCLGPVTGGIIAQRTTWRWVFYIMFPFCALGLGLVLRFLTVRAPPAILRERMEWMHWLGGLLFIASSTLILIAISWGGSLHSWFSAGTVVPLCLGVLGLGSTFIYEAKFAAQPFLLRSLFWHTCPIVTYTCGLIQGFVVS